MPADFAISKPTMKQIEFFLSDIFRLQANTMGCIHTISLDSLYKLSFRDAHPFPPTL